MSAVYQDVIEGYLIASIKVFSKIDVLIYLNLNSETESTQKPQPFQLVGWFIFGSFLILKGAFLNYLDNAYGESQVKEGVSNLLRRGRSLETKQETTLDDLTLLPWTKGADQEKRLFEYQLGVSGFIFMGLTSHQYQFAMPRFHIGPIHPNYIYQTAGCFSPTLPMVQN